MIRHYNLIELVAEMLEAGSDKNASIGLEAIERFVILEWTTTHPEHRVLLAGARGVNLKKLVSKYAAHSNQDLAKSARRIMTATIRSPVS